MTGKLALDQIVAVEVRALLVAVPDDFAIPVVPGVVGNLGAVDAIEATL